MGLMTIETSIAPPAMDAAVNAVRDLDAFDQLLAACTIVHQLSHPYKSFLHCLLEQLLDNEETATRSPISGVEYDRDFSKQPLGVILRRLCLLKPEEAQSVLAMSNVIEERYQQRVMANNASLFSQNEDMQLQHILSIAVLHPAFTEIQQHKFARLAAALASQEGAGYPLVITSSSELPSSPTTSTSPASSSPLTSSLASLSPQNSSGLSSSSYNSHAPLQSTLSAPPVHRISSASHLGPRSSLVAEADYHHRLHRSLSSSPSAHSLGDSEPLSGISDSNGSLINIPADESYVYTPPKAGMRDVPAWLKGLRLHKYCGLLASKSYDELLNVTETQLETWNVTKGARTKIVSCIQKLHERPDEMVKLVKQVNDVGDVRTVLNEVRNLLATPMRLAPRLCVDFAKIQSIEDIPPQDLAAKLTFVLHKMENVYCNTGGPISAEDDCIGPFIQLLDRCMRHEAFYGTLRATLLSLKQSLQALMRNTTFPGHRKLTKSYTTASVSSASAFGPAHSFGESQGCITRNAEADTFFLPVPDGFSTRPALQQQHHRPLHRCFALNKGPVEPTFPNENSLFLKPKTPLGRTRSAPVAPKPLTAAQSNLWFDGVDADLESLTLSVTEHALPSIEQTTF